MSKEKILWEEGRGKEAPSLLEKHHSYIEQKQNEVFGKVAGRPVSKFLSGPVAVKAFMEGGAEGIRALASEDNGKKE